MHVSEFEEAYDDIQLIRGAILSTPVSDLNPRSPLVVDAEDSVLDAVEAMNEHHTGCVLVERDGKLAGIFTERDVLTRVIFRDDNRLAPVESFMTEVPETLDPTASIAYALNTMSVGGYRHIPIVDARGRAVGVVSIRDLVDFLVQLFPGGVLNLPPSPDKEIPRTMDGG